LDTHSLQARKRLRRKESEKNCWQQAEPLPRRLFHSRGREDLAWKRKRGDIAHHPQEPLSDASSSRPGERCTIMLTNLRTQRPIYTMLYPYQQHTFRVVQKHYSDQDGIEPLYISFTTMAAYRNRLELFYCATLSELSGISVLFASHDAYRACVECCQSITDVDTHLPLLRLVLGIAYSIHGVWIRWSYTSRDTGNNIS
jgi:hypothetical protein